MPDDKQEHYKKTLKYSTLLYIVLCKYIYLCRY